MTYKDYPLSADTTPEAEAVLFELLGKKSPAEKLRMVSRMNASVRALALTGLRARHPGENSNMLKVRMAEMLYGAAVAADVAKRQKPDQFDE